MKVKQLELLPRGNQTILTNINSQSQTETKLKQIFVSFSLSSTLFWPAVLLIQPPWSCPQLHFPHSLYLTDIYDMPWDHSLPEGVIWPNEYGRTLGHDRCIQHKVAFLAGLIYCWGHDSSMNSFEGVFLMSLHKCSLVGRETGGWTLSEGKVLCYMRGKAGIMGFDLCSQGKGGLQMFDNTLLSRLHFCCSQHSFTGQKTSNFLWMSPRHQVHLENGSLKINL